MNGWSRLCRGSAVYQGIGRRLEPAAVLLADALFAQHSLVRFNALVLTGGETAAAVLGVLKVTRLELVEELEPGIPVSRILDGYAPGALCITKAGGFGDDQALVRMVERLGMEWADDEG